MSTEDGFIYTPWRSAKDVPEKVATITGGRRMSGHKGLYGKYIVFRTEEIVNSTLSLDTLLDNRALDGCFVLRPVTDTAARIALATYAEATHNPRLGADIRAWLEEFRGPSR